MKRTEVIDKRFQEVLELGSRVLLTRRSAPPGVVGQARVDAQQAQQWAASAAQLLVDVVGKDSEYVDQFRKGFEVPGFISDMTRGFAVVQAAWNDYSKGYLVRVKTLIEAELFDELLEQAGYLLEQGYYQAAAVLAGGVLEDSLRKLCDRKGVVLPSKPKIDQMNADLARSGTYNVLVQKRITWLADLRNKAAHGQWTEFSSTDVGDMLRQVREFVTDNAV